MYAHQRTISLVEGFRGSTIWLAAPDSHLNIRFGDPVKIAAAGHEEIALCGEIKVFGGLAGRVGAVMDFDASQSGGFEFPHQHAQALGRCPDPCRVGQHRHTAGFTNPSHGFGRLGEFTVDKGRTAVCQIPVEGFFRRRHELFLHQQTGNVWASHGFRACQGSHFFIRDGNAQLIEALDDLRIAQMAAVAQGLQALRQLRIGPLHKISEDVQFALSEPRTDFNAGHHFDAEFFPDRRRFRNAVDNVVIRNGEGREAGLLGKGHDLGC